MSEELKQESQRNYALARKLRAEAMYVEGVGGISRANVIANRAHLPESIKLESYNDLPTPVGKTIYTESLAKAALMAVAVAVIAGLGYLAWRLISTKPVSNTLRSNETRKALDAFSELKKAVRLLHEFPMRYTEASFVEPFMQEYNGIIAPDFAHGKSEYEQYKNLLGNSILSYYRNDLPNRLTAAILVGKYEFCDRVADSVIRNVQPRLNDFVTKFMPKVLDHYKRNGSDAPLDTGLRKLMEDLVADPDSVRSAVGAQTQWLERNAPGIIGPTDSYRDVAVRFVDHLAERIKLDPYADQIDWAGLDSLQEPRFSSYDSIGKQFGDLAALGEKLKSLSAQFKGTVINDKEIEARIEAYIEDMQLHLDVVESTAKACVMEVEALRSIAKAIADAGREIYKTASKVARSHPDQDFGKKLYSEFEKEIRNLKV